MISVDGLFTSYDELLSCRVCNAFHCRHFYFLRTPSTVYDTCRINLASRFPRAPYVGHEAPVSQDLYDTVYMHIWLCKKYPGFSLLLGMLICSSLWYVKFAFLPPLFLHDVTMSSTSSYGLFFFFNSVFFPSFLSVRCMFSFYIIFIFFPPY